MFALLFAGQTIASAFDLHSSHQNTDSTQNLSHRNLDESHKSHQEGTLASTLNNPFDCHHCCHCHAPTVVYITCNISTSFTHKSNDNILTRKVALVSLWITPEHRPPIV
jgi:hypothetical protein